MDFFPEQKAAIENLDDNICLSAGAGSGKTTVLAERFVHILATARKQNPDFSPRHILTLTFTDEAAIEMRKRIATRLEAWGLEALLPELTQSYISTIHGFCWRMIRENIFDTTLDSDTRVQEAPETEFFLKEILSALLEELFHAGDPAVRLLLENYRASELVQGLLEIYKKINAYDLSPQELSGHEEQQWPWPEIIKQAHDLATGQNYKITPALIQKQAFISAQILPLLTKLTPQVAVAQSSAEKARIFLATFLDHEPDLFFRSNLRDERWKETLANYKATLTSFKALLIDQAVGPLKQAFIALLSQFSARVQQNQRSQKVIDFDTIQTTAKKLLETHPDILRKYQEQFPYIMVDEYQDTNSLQDHIISLLSTHSKLFVVGDRKQAIYGFRNADDRLLGAKEKAYADQERHQLIDLMRNFRSTAPILSFVNTVFADLWAQGNLGRFMPLQAQRPAQCWPAVSAWFLPLEEKLTAEARRFREAERLVEIISAAVAKADHPLRYGDIAVLFRALSAVDIYTQALQRAGIPFQITSSGSFYERREARDVWQFFKVLLDPQADLSLAAFLLSPWVGLSDQCLLALRQTRDQSLLDALGQAPDNTLIPPQDKERIAFFMPRLKDLLAARTMLGPHRLLSQAYEILAVRAGYAKSNKGHDCQLALDKLSQLTLDFELENGPDSAAFVTHLGHLIEQKVKENDLTYEEESADCVRIYTVHKAKGLEYRLVVIPDVLRSSHRQPAKGSMSFNLTAQSQLGLRVAAAYTGQTDSRKLDSFTYLQNKEQASLAEIAEDLRVFYVACTRARDRLVLLGLPAEPAKNPSAWGELLQATSALDQVDRHDITKPYGAVPEVKVIPSPQSDWEPELSAAKKDAILAAVRREISPSGLPTAIGVTAYLRYLRCPREYFWRQNRVDPDFWGLKSGETAFDALAAERESLPDGESILPRSSFGTKMHEILECYNFSLPWASQWPGIAEQLVSLAPSEQERVSQILQKLETTALAQDMARLETKREFSFAFHLDGSILSATADVLIWSEANSYALVDYKTGQLPAQSRLCPTDHQYARQLALYAIGLQKVFGCPPRSAQLCFLDSATLVDVDISPAILQEEDQLARRTLSALRAGHFDLADNQTICASCHYQALCD